MKTYDPTAWERLIPVTALQADYDTQGWEGEGAYRAYNVERLAARVRELLQTQERVSVLEVACFAGDYAVRLHQLVSDGLDYTGCDVTPSYLAAAAARLPQAKFVEGSALELPFPDNSFDLVFNSGMLIHVADPERCIREFARVAKHQVLLSTTTGLGPVDTVEMGMSGPEFIDHVYRPAYILRLLEQVGRVEQLESIPYRDLFNTLFEVAV